MQKADKNKSRTRLEQREADIIDAATGLFADEGFHGTSTRKIAAAAGVSEGTLFHYFSTKNALLLAILDEFYERLTASARTVTDEVMGTRERLLLLAKNHLRALMENQALMMRLIQVYLAVDRNYYKDYRNSPIHEFNYRYTRVFDNVIREGMERGYIRPDLELSAMRDLFFGGLEYGMRTLMGRKYNNNQVAAYVEAIVEPLWQSMQSNTGTAGEMVTDKPLHDTLERLEAVAMRLEKAVP